MSDQQSTGSGGDVKQSKKQEGKNDGVWIFLSNFSDGFGGGRLKGSDERGGLTAGVLYAVSSPFFSPSQASQHALHAHMASG